MSAFKESFRLADKAVEFGFEWPKAEMILDQIRSECDEIQAELEGPRALLEAEVGDLMHAAVDLCRYLNMDPEGILAAANEKFDKRLNLMFEAASKDGHTDLVGHDVKILLKYWEMAKES